MCTMWRKLNFLESHGVQTLFSGRKYRVITIYNTIIPWDKCFGFFRSLRTEIGQGNQLKLMEFLLHQEPGERGREKKMKPGERRIRIHMAI